MSQNADAENRAKLFPDLPFIEAPHIAQAALACKSYEASMTTPRHLDLSRTTGVHNVHKMRTLDMQVRENAFLSANWLLYLTKPSQTVQELVACDTKELQDAVWRTLPPDGTLPPRRMSLVFMSRGETAFAGFELLCVASHLASELGFGCVERSSRSARFTFLAGVDAEQFLRLRRDALPEASRNVDLIPPTDGTGDIAVVVSWAVRMASQTVLHTHLGRIPAPASRGDVGDLYDQVVSTISGICASNAVPIPRGITASRNPPNMNSFVEQQVKIYTEFQDLLLPEPQVLLSTHIKDSSASLEFSDMYVRLCPRSYPLDHYSAHTGCLLQEKGKEAQLTAFLRGCRENETSEVYGLSPPENSYQQQIGIHVLSATTVSLQLGTAVSSYAMGCHPGARLHVKDGCFVWRILREIAPLEVWLKRDNYVLPCSHACCHPRASILQLPLFDLLERTIIETVEVFGEPSVLPPRAIEKRAPRMAGSPSDLFYATAFGLGMHVDAVRVGDVLDQVSAASGRPDGLCKLLLTVVNKVGASLSITDAMQWMADGYCSMEQRVAMLEQQLHDTTIKEPIRLEPASPSGMDSRTVMRVTDALRLKQAPAFAKMHNPPQENELDKLTHLVCKTLRLNKKDIAKTTLNALKSVHAASNQESLTARLLAVTLGLAEETRTRCFTFVHEGSRTKLFRGNTSAGLESLFEEGDALAVQHLSLVTGKLHYYEFIR